MFLQLRRLPLLIVLSVILSFVSGCTMPLPRLASSGIVKPISPSQQPVAETSFKTPEEAITQYLSGVAQNDIEMILNTTAVNEMAEKFDLEAFVARIRALTPLTSEGPANYSFYSEINRSDLTGQQLRNVKFLAYSLLSDVPIDQVTATGDVTEIAAKFIKDVDPSRLSELKIERIDMPAKELMSQERYLTNSLEAAKVYGADDQTERVVLLSLGDENYVMGFTLLRYGDSWKIAQPSSPIGNTSTLGATKITVDEYLSSIDQ